MEWQAEQAAAEEREARQKVREADAAAKLADLQVKMEKRAAAAAATAAAATVAPATPAKNAKFEPLSPAARPLGAASTRETLSDLLQRCEKRPRYIVVDAASVAVAGQRVCAGGLLRRGCSSLRELAGDGRGSRGGAAGARVGRARGGVSGREVRQAASGVRRARPVGAARAALPRAASRGTLSFKASSGDGRNLRA